MLIKNKIFFCKNVKPWQKTQHFGHITHSMKIMVPLCHSGTCCTDRPARPRDLACHSTVLATAVELMIAVTHRREVTQVGRARVHA